MPTAAIIGAGPAGSTAAIFLARAGWNVSLIEQHHFPRDKVCGECLSALGIGVLRRLNVHDQIRSHDPVELTHASLHANSGERVQIALNAPMWGISRRRLDAVLLDAARHAGTQVFQPARCESIAHGVLSVRELSTNRPKTLHPDHVLLADGKGALLPQRAKPTTDFGVKAHFTNVSLPKNAIALFGFRNHYGGVAPIEDARWDLAFSAPAALLSEHSGDLDRLFAAILRQNVDVARAFASSRRISDWLTSPLPRFRVAEKWPLRTIPLGNAAAALEPIGGEGIGLAMRSSELAAESLIADPSSAQRPALRRQFKELWQIRSPACRVAARMLSSPSLAGPTVQLLARNKTLTRWALQLMGKSKD